MVASSKRRHRRFDVKERTLFSHTKQFQYNAKPDDPDPVFAKQMQELIGGQWGEMSVMVNYLFQGWNCRGPAKYRDMLLDTATEEIGHVEMLATMVARLLETSPVEAEKAAENGGDGGVVGSVLGGGDTQQAIINAAMNPQHAIVTGGGASPRDSLGNPWNSGYIVASGNLLADMRFNVTAESQDRLQVARASTSSPRTRACATCSRSFWPATPCTRTSGLRP